jgi:transcription-repair coupling factor (superfamily II helicase)
LPARGTQLALGGLPGSSPAVMLAWLARTFPERFFTVVATTPADAERWLTDLQHLTDLPIALYPQRESLGEDEPHYEIAGERAETLSGLLEGRLRILVTTARATEERTRVAATLREATLRIRPHSASSARPRPGSRTGTALSDVAAALEAMGYTRVPTVTEVAQFSVRGGIIDVYGFGMANPARLEWWGDDLESIRVFDLTTQRSADTIDEVTVLPLGGSARRQAAESGDTPPAGPALRQGILELLPSDTLIVEDSATANQEEVSRSWREAAHHLEIARRLGEEVSAREDLFEPPESWARRMTTFPRISTRDPAAALNAGFFPPEAVERDIRRLRGMLAGAIPSLILCDNEGQLERLDELLNEGGSRVNATLAIGALDGGFVMRSPHRPRDFPSSPAAAARPALSSGGAFGGDRPAAGWRLRGPPRARHRSLPRHPDDHRRGVDARGRDCRIRRWGSPQCAAVPAGSAGALPRRGRRRGSATTQAAQARRQRVAAGAGQDPAGHQGDGRRAARSVRAAQGERRVFLPA